MLKKRIIGCLPVIGGIVVRSVMFKQSFPMGKPAIAIEFLNQWGIDEIVLLDITATAKNKNPDMALIRQSAKKCQVPLTVGGGISKFCHVYELLHSGADKVSLNTALVQNPGLITQIAKAYGTQCVMVSIDSHRIGNRYRSFDHLKKTVNDISVSDAAKMAVDLGAGELLINSIDRDGTYRGYDMPLIETVCEAVKVPVVAVGGAKNAGDMVKLLEQTPASAACAGNFFHFQEHSVNIAKRFMCDAKIKIRFENKVDYAGHGFDDHMRLKKITDDELENLLFVKIEKEII